MADLLLAAIKNHPCYTLSRHVAESLFPHPHESYASWWLRGFDDPNAPPLEPWKTQDQRLDDFCKEHNLKWERDKVTQEITFTRGPQAPSSLLEYAQSQFPNSLQSTWVQVDRALIPRSDVGILRIFCKQCTDPIPVHLHEIQLDALFNMKLVILQRVMWAEQKERERSRFWVYYIGLCETCHTVYYTSALPL